MARAGQVVVKQGSLGRPWRIVIDEPDPTDPDRRRRRPVDLTLLNTATLRFRLGPAPGQGTERGGPCAVGDPLAGEVLFSPGAEDVDTPGEFAGTLALDWLPAAGVPSPELVPYRGYLGIVVEPV